MFSYTYQNDQIVNPSWVYDAGDGREGKRRKLTEDANGNAVEELNYYIRSSVLGGEVVSETNATGRKKKTYVRAAGATLAWQTVYYNTTDNTSSEFINFEHQDSSGSSRRSTTTSGETIYGEGAEGSPAELDPLGGNVGLTTPYEAGRPPVEPEYPSLLPFDAFDSPMTVNGQQVTCSLDGMAV